MMDASNRTALFPLPFRPVRKLASFCLLGAVVLLCVACGKRGDPLPPLRPVPAPVAHIFIAQRGETVHLEWISPTRNLDGSTGVNLEKVEILRRIIEIPPPPPVAPPPTLEPGLEAAGPEQEAQTTPDAPATETPASQETVETEGTQEPPGSQEQQEATSTQEVEPEVQPGEEGQPVEASEEEQQSEEAGQKGEEQPPETAPTTLIVQTPTAPAPFPAGARVIATLESLEMGVRETYDDPWDPSMKKMRVEYGIRHFNQKGRAGTRFSYVAQIELRPPFVPPTDLLAEVHEGLVRLQWNPDQEIPEPEPAEPEAGEPAASEPAAGESETLEPETLEPERVERKFTYAFNVFRKSRSEDYYPQKAVNAIPIEQPRFDDRKVVFGKSWCYIVRRVALLVPEEPMPVLLEPVETEEAPGEAPPEGAEPPSQAGDPPSPSSPGEAQSSPAQPTPAQPTSAPDQQTPASQPASPPSQGTPVPPALPPVPPAPPPLTAPLESGDSEEVCLTPLDTFAPATPGDVFAIASSGGILLSWREASASDLAGYRVYRAERSEGPYDLLTPEPIRFGSFTDRNVEPGIEYYYRVAAVDRVEPPNESPLSAVVSARAAEP